MPRLDGDWAADVERLLEDLVARVANPRMPSGGMREAAPLRLHALTRVTAALRRAADALPTAAAATARNLAVMAGGYNAEMEELRREHDLAKFIFSQDIPGHALRTCERQGPGGSLDVADVQALPEGHPVRSLLPLPECWQGRYLVLSRSLDPGVEHSSRPVYDRAASLAATRQRRQAELDKLEQARHDATLAGRRMGLP